MKMYKSRLSVIRYLITMLALYIVAVGLLSCCVQGNIQNNIEPFPDIDENDVDKPNFDVILKFSKKVPNNKFR